MELKKSKKADLEWRKPTFLQLGLVVALLLVFISFELIGSREKPEGKIFNDKQDGWDVLPDIPKIDQSKALPMPPKQLAETLIETVKTTVGLDDLVIDAGVKPDDVIPDVVYVIVDTKIDEPLLDDIPFKVVEEMPEYPDGDDARLKFLQENLVYPKYAREVGLEGKVYVGFVVERDGSLSNFTIKRSVAPILDEEALRVVKMMPKWNPGQQRGKAVRVEYQIPITFTLMN